MEGEQSEHQAKEAGMRFSGKSADNKLVEIIELPDHPWFVATQFHPEFKSRPTRPHPLFRGFVAASVERAHGQAGERLAGEPIATHSRNGHNGHAHTHLPESETAK
ncbi:MAG TPA: hypothetical protein VFQ25_08035 [Ktedonobacterales bacterium]|nr:hypothetical protein [Ktedonobacterales bacterium]